MHGLSPVALASFIASGHKYHSRVSLKCMSAKPVHDGEAIKTDLNVCGCHYRPHPERVGTNQPLVALPLQRMAFYRPFPFSNPQPIHCQLRSIFSHRFRVATLMTYDRCGCRLKDCRTPIPFHLTRHRRKRRIARCITSPATNFSYLHYNALSRHLP